MFGGILTGEREGASARSNRSLPGQMRQREANENGDKSNGEKRTDAVNGECERSERK